MIEIPKRTQVITNPIHKKSLRIPSPEEIDQLKKELIKISSLLGNVYPWELSGGLVLPLTFEVHPYQEMNSFYRPHSAFHISLHESQLQPLTERMMNTDESDYTYGLFIRNASIQYKYRKVDFYTPITTEKALTPLDPKRISERPKNLRWVRMSNQGKIQRHNKRTDYFDIYPYQYQTKDRKKVIALDGKYYVDKKPINEEEVYVVSHENKLLWLPVEVYKGEKYTLENSILQLASVDWIKKVKENRQKKDDVDLHDLTLIDQYLHAKKGLEHCVV